MRFQPVLVGLSVLLSLASASADAFSARVMCIGTLGCSPGLAPPPIIDSPSPASTSATVTITTVGVVSDEAIASANPGSVGGLSHANFTLDSFFPITWGGVAQESSSSAIQILLGGPPEMLGQTIEISFNTFVEGSYGASSSGGPFGANFSGTFGGTWGSSYGGGGWQLGTIFGDPFGQLVTTGVFSSAGSGTILGTGTSPTFFARVGDVITIGFSLETSAVAAESFGGGPGYADAFIDLSHTAGFLTTGNVFNLPDGVTANSLDGFTIVNNQFGDTTSVPEPASLTLLAAGVLGMARRFKSAGRDRAA